MVVMVETRNEPNDHITRKLTQDDDNMSIPNTKQEAALNDQVWREVLWRYFTLVRTAVTRRSSINDSDPGVMVQATARTTAMRIIDMDMIVHIRSAATTRIDIDPISF